MTGIYQAFGLNILSEIDLPELLPGDLEQTIDVCIRFGKIPEQLTNSVKIDTCSQVNDDCFQLNIDNTARYQSIAGKKIIVCPHTKSAAIDVRLYLLGTVFGALLHQRKIMPLHASAVDVDGKAIAFAGDSGVGKSTTVAFLQQLGYKIISDDIIALSRDKNGNIMVCGGFPRIKLWGDAADELNMDKSKLIRDRLRTDKYHIKIELFYQAKPVPLKSIYLLCKKSSSEQEEIKQIKGMDAVTTLIQNTYRSYFVNSLNFEKEHFLYCISIATTVSIYQLSRFWGKESINQWLEKLEKHWKT